MNVHSQPFLDFFYITEGPTSDILLVSEFGNFSCTSFKDIDILN